jgi:hypothetical protein
MSDASDLEIQRERAAKNQSLFREVNERIEDLAGSASFPSFICECMNESCDEGVAMTVQEYEHVRAGGNRFFVLPGHDVPAVEEIVETNDRFVVVGKLGVGASVAEQLNPRSRGRDDGHR